MARFEWRNNVQAQVVDADIDGLLCAAFLWATKGWPVVGFYDTEHLWLSETGAALVANHLDRVAWVDIDMVWPGCQSLSQHVVMRAPGDANVVAALQASVNPNVIAGHCDATDAGYMEKYPFGTFQWLLWLAGIPLPGVQVRLQHGLFWMPDGGFVSINGDWAENCFDWASRRLAGSPLAAMAVPERRAATPTVVTEAEHHLRWVSRVNDPGLWPNHQFQMSHNAGNGVIVDVDPADPRDRARVQALLVAIAGAFGWPAVTLPDEFARWNGVWVSAAAPPVGWPGMANERSVVSMAVTSRHRYCYTLPGTIADILP